MENLKLLYHACRHSAKIAVENKALDYRSKVDNIPVNITREEVVELFDDIILYGQKVFDVNCIEFNNVDLHNISNLIGFIHDTVNDKRKKINHSNIAVSLFTYLYSEHNFGNMKYVFADVDDETIVQLNTLYGRPAIDKAIRTMINMTTT